MNAATTKYTKLRKHPRARLYHSVVLKDTQALVVDVSESGLRVRIPEGLALKARDKIKLEWQALSNLPSESLEAKCRWVHGGEAGFLLVAPTKRQRAWLRALVYYHRTPAELGINSR
jgi:hypothetical protein